MGSHSACIVKSLRIPTGHQDTLEQIIKNREIAKELNITPVLGKKIPG
jgi:hypothetical protein